jgi:hypothetical protein
MHEVSVRVALTSPEDRIKEAPSLATSNAAVAEGEAIPPAYAPKSGDFF